MVDFSAKWCAPCQALKPDFEKLATSEKYSGSLLFVEVDVDECQDTQGSFEVFSLPTIVFIASNGEQDKDKKLALSKIDEALIEEKILSKV